MIKNYKQIDICNKLKDLNLNLLIKHWLTSKDYLENPDLKTVPVHLSWTRIGQYLPWMRMGSNEGKLIYHAQGYKVLDGWDGLPSDLKEWTLSNAPEYQYPPEQDEYPNMTSWRYMRKIVDDGTYDPSCP